MKEFIICAAIYYDDGEIYDAQPTNIEFGLIVTGRRHRDCHNTLDLITKGDYTVIIDREHQGFLTSTNRFVSREEAFQIAKQNNQIYHTLHDDVDENDLISEDLY